MNNICKFLSNNDNITTIISVLAFVLSMINTFYLIFTQRPKIKVSFKEYTFLKKFARQTFSAWSYNRKQVKIVRINLKDESEY